MPDVEWDVFISHAWEDKEFAGQLANELKKRGLRVWFDEFTLHVGDSLRASIDRGLANSRFGVVVLSRDFFAKKKKWTQAELNGLFARERPDKKVILPVWHNITAEELEKYSPILADHWAVTSESGLESVVTRLMQAIEQAYVSPTFLSDVPSTKRPNVWDSIIRRAKPYPVQANDERSLEPKRKLKVFLCHSSRDKPVVRDLYQRLKSDGFDPWLDEENILPGQDWENEIRKAVRNTDVVLLCLSSLSVSKAGYFHKEFKYAWDVAQEQPEGVIFIIPLKLEICDVPEQVRHLHWANLFEDRGYGNLKRALRARSENLKIL